MSRRVVPKIFATGPSGYIGGTALDTINEAHPEYEIYVYVRDTEKADIIARKYPYIRFVHGDLNSDRILQKAMEKMDCIIHFADCDHVPGVKSIIAGMNKRETPGYFIHTSGAAILPDVRDKSDFGKSASSKVYNDLEGVAEVTSFPEDGHLHREVDALVIAANSSPLINTAIVCPPTVYGTGTGACNKRSNQIPQLVKYTLQRGQAFQVEQGKTIWSNVHVKDLAKLYLALVEAALQKGGNATWGPEAYYFAENGEHTWGDISALIAKKAHERGLIRSAIVESLSTDEVAKLNPFGPILWGTNSRSKALRARKLLGWEPTEPALEDTLDEAIALEAKSLRLW